MCYPARWDAPSLSSFASALAFGIVGGSILTSSLVTPLIPEPISDASVGSRRSPYDPNKYPQSLEEQQSTLKSWAHVWADEKKNTQDQSLHKSFKSLTTGCEMPSSDTWRPPLMISQDVPSPKTSSGTIVHASQWDTFLMAFSFCMGISGFWKLPALTAEHGGKSS